MTTENRIRAIARHLDGDASDIQVAIERTLLALPAVFRGGVLYDLQTSVADNTISSAQELLQFLKNQTQLYNATFPPIIEQFATFGASHPSQPIQPTTKPSGRQIRPTETTPREPKRKRRRLGRLRRARPDSADKDESDFPDRDPHDEDRKETRVSRVSDQTYLANAETLVEGIFDKHFLKPSLQDVKLWKHNNSVLAFNYVHERYLQYVKSGFMTGDEFIQALETVLKLPKVGSGYQARQRLDFLDAKFMKAANKDKPTDQKLYVLSVRYSPFYPHEMTEIAIMLRDELGVVERKLSLMYQDQIIHGWSWLLMPHDETKKPTKTHEQVLNDIQTQVMKLKENLVRLPKDIRKIAFLGLSPSPEMRLEGDSMSPFEVWVNSRRSEFSLKGLSQQDMKVIMKTLRDVNASEVFIESFTTRISSNTPVSSVSEEEEKSQEAFFGGVANDIVTVVVQEFVSKLETHLLKLKKFIDTDEIDTYVWKIFMDVYSYWYPALLGYPRARAALRKLLTSDTPNEDRKERKILGEEISREIRKKVIQNKRVSQDIDTSSTSEIQSRIVPILQKYVEALQGSSSHTADAILIENSLNNDSFIREAFIFAQRQGFLDVDYDLHSTNLADLSRDRLREVVSRASKIARLAEKVDRVVKREENMKLLALFATVLEASDQQLLRTLMQRTSFLRRFDDLAKKYRQYTMYFDKELKEDDTRNIQEAAREVLAIGSEMVVSPLETLESKTRNIAPNEHLWLSPVDVKVRKSERYMSMIEQNTTYIQKKIRESPWYRALVSLRLQRNLFRYEKLANPVLKRLAIDLVLTEKKDMNDHRVMMRELMHSKNTTTYNADFVDSLLSDTLLVIKFMPRDYEYYGSHQKTGRSLQARVNNVEEPGAFVSLVHTFRQNIADVKQDPQIIETKIMYRIEESGQISAADMLWYLKRVPMDTFSVMLEEWNRGDLQAQFGSKYELNDDQIYFLAKLGTFSEMRSDPMPFVVFVRTWTNYLVRIREELDVDDFDLNVLFEGKVVQEEFATIVRDDMQNHGTTFAEEVEATIVSVADDEASVIKMYVKEIFTPEILQSEFGGELSVDNIQAILDQATLSLNDITFLHDHNLLTSVIIELVASHKIRVPPLDAAGSGTS